MTRQNLDELEKRAQRSRRLFDALVYSLFIPAILSLVASAFEIPPKPADLASSAFLFLVVVVALLFWQRTEVLPSSFTLSERVRYCFDLLSRLSGEYAEHYDDVKARKRLARRCQLVVSNLVRAVAPYAPRSPFRNSPYGSSVSAGADLFTAPLSTFSNSVTDFGVLASTLFKKQVKSPPDFIAAVKKVSEQLELGTDLLSDEHAKAVASAVSAVAILGLEPDAEMALPPGPKFTAATRRWWLALPIFRRRLVVGLIVTAVYWPVLLAGPGWLSVMGIPTAILAYLAILAIIR